MKDQIEFRNKVAELRKRKSNLPPALGVLSTFLFVGVGLWVLEKNFTAWAGILVFILIGFMQYRLVLASHEAVHKNLFHPVWLNEAAGTGLRVGCGRVALQLSQGAPGPSQGPAVDPG